MGTIEQVDIEPIKTLLRMCVPAKAAELDALLIRLSPRCELDRASERLLFQADADRRVIRIGTKGTMRLQAHSLAASVLITAIGSPGFRTMTSQERRRLLQPADALLTWAVGRDLQQWLEQIGRGKLELSDILRGAENDLPDDLLASIDDRRRGHGEALFRFASAFIILHELGHLHFGHRHARGIWSIEQEKAADWFAAEWLTDAASAHGSNPRARRLNVLFGIAVALLWITVFNIYLGQSQGDSHPQGYDRLFQVIDRVADWSDADEHNMIWYFISTMLFIHMDSAGIDVEPNVFRNSDPRLEVSFLIDIISKRDRS